MKTSDISKFKKVLENNKRLLVFSRNTATRRNICLDIITSYKDIPWLIFVSLTGVPILIALCYAMRILGNIASGESFTKKNSDCIRKIAMLALIDAIFFFTGNIIMLILNMNHPAVMLIFLVISLIGISLYVAFSILTYLIDKIDELKKKTED